MITVLFLSGTLIAFVATKLVITVSLRRRILDVPNSRSSHSSPIPRLGGIGIILGFYVPLGVLYLARHGTSGGCLLSSPTLLVLIIAGPGIAAAGLYDDLYRLTPAVKFVFQFLLALVVVGAGIRFGATALPLMHPFAQGLLAVPLTILWMVGFSNLYNFMDGIDGMAGVTGAIYSVLLVLFALRLGAPTLAVVGAPLAGSCLGFLFHNFPGARTFMGDVGSLFLGMIFAVLMVQLSHLSQNPASLVNVLLVCSVYLYDGSFTLVRRMARRENIFQAHRSHLYQRLVQSGWTHKRVTLLYLLLHAVMGSLALMYLRAGETARLSILGAAALVLIAFTASVYWRERSVARASKGAGQLDTPPELAWKRSLAAR